MSEEIVIRLAERRDLPALGRLGALLVRTHHEFDRARFMMPKGDLEEGYAWFLGTQLDDANQVIYVVASPDVLPKSGNGSDDAYLNWCCRNRGE